MKTLKDSEISRTISHALRHAPQQYGLTLDEHGWAPLPQLLAALTSLGPEWGSVDVPTIERLCKEATKKRHELSGGRIRAVHGHSLSVDTGLAVQTPPATLFHGTSPVSLPAILTEGLKPMGRTHVHLDETADHAAVVGRRKHPAPVVLGVDTAAAIASGISFARAPSGVWLSSAIPATALHLEK